MWIITRSNAQLFTIQIKDDKWGIMPQICQREKVDWQVKLTPISGLEAFFDRVEISTYHSDVLDKDLENINLYLWDDEWEYKLSTAWTALGRNILNALANEESLGKLTITVSATEKWGKTYPNIWIKNNGNKTSWKLSWDEQKVLVDVITNKKGEFVSSDYTALNEKLASFVPEINKKSTKLTSETAKKMFDDWTKEDSQPLPF